MNTKVVEFIKQIPGWLTEKEGQFLLDAAKNTQDKKGEIVEIGSFCGKSTIWLASSGKKVYAVDPHQGNVTEQMQFGSTFRKFKSNLRKAHVASHVRPIRKTAKDAALTWNKPIRLLFIDALHDEGNARQDFQLWEKFVVSGGVIAIHDSFLHWCGSEKVALQHVINNPLFTNIGYKDSILYGVKNGNPTFRDFFVRLFINSAIFLHHLWIMVKLPFRLPIRFARS